MPDDLVSRVSLPTILTGVSVAFQPQGMIADMVCPRIPVLFQSGKYRVFGKNNMVRRDSKWAPGTIPNQIQSRWSLDTYFVDTAKLRHPLLDAELANNNTIALGGMDLRTQYTQTTTEAIAISREARVAALFTNPANYPAANVITKAPGSEYDQAGMGGQQVISDLRRVINAAADATMRPKSELSVIIPEPAWRGAFDDNTAILESIKYTERGVVTTDSLAALLGVEEVILAQSMAAGAGPEIAGSDVIDGYITTYLWGDTIWAGLIGDSNQATPSFARSFNWTAATDGEIRRTREYRMADEGQEGNWIEVAEAVDEKIVFKGGGAIITNTLSTI